jgi:hypothetical protein
MRVKIISVVVDILTGLAAFFLFILGDAFIHLAADLRLCILSLAVLYLAAGFVRGQGVPWKRLAERTLSEFRRLARSARSVMGAVVTSHRRHALGDRESLRHLWCARPPSLAVFRKQSSLDAPRSSYRTCFSGRYGRPWTCYPDRDSSDERCRSPLFRSGSSTARC